MEFGFEAQKYNDEMIIVAPQLNDWGETSADQTIALVEYFLQQYHIDTGIPPGKIIMLLNVQHKQAVNFFFRQSLPLIQVIKRICSGVRRKGSVRQ